MMQLQRGRRIHDLNLSEIYTLLSYSRETIMSFRKKFDFMQHSPLRDPPVLPFEVQVEQFKSTTKDAFLGGDLDVERARNTNEATRIINIDSLRENKSYYLIDQWFPTPEPMQHSPLRDPPVLPFEVQVEQFKSTTKDAFLGGDLDVERARNTNEATRIINIDSLRENKSYYLIDQWFPTPEPPKPVTYQQIGYETSNRRGYNPYQGSSSNGNPNFEMMSVSPK
uniref:Uncharacterized protein n=1 Tax=Arabidopsis thaliana TaxID=3702 RepID=Q84LR4_ARATH|nr:hypothetical protein [Arabidopsis thaliana]